MYSSGRYFTVTGSRWRICADEIAEDNGVIDFVHKTFIVIAILCSCYKMHEG